MTANAVEIRVIYADTDAMGIAYHTNYIRWFEIGRTELLRGMGIVYRDLESEGFYLPLTELYCHYLKPARYDDLLRVETRINYFRRASIKFDYEIWDEKRENCLVEGSTIHAFLNREGKIVRPPRPIADKLNHILSSRSKA
ncbi:MAG TPA: thioesterase family protein [Syntrophales bacterium]|nr:thioesterase family protein [Syntrophales bacterium]HRT61400.1 thioesterase family protein [Syntrophales bacterium]